MDNNTAVAIEVEKRGLGFLTVDWEGINPPICGRKYDFIHYDDISQYQHNVIWASDVAGTCDNDECTLPDSLTCDKCDGVFCGNHINDHKCESDDDGWNWYEDDMYENDHDDGSGDWWAQ